MVKVGLVTFAVTPSARHAPRTKVVLPTPRSPLTSTTSPGSRSAASRAPAASVSVAELLEQAQLVRVTGVRLVLAVLGQKPGQLREVGAQQLHERVRTQRRRRVEHREEPDHPARHLAILR